MRASLNGLTISHLCLSALPSERKEVPTTAQTALRRQFGNRSSTTHGRVAGALLIQRAYSWAQGQQSACTPSLRSTKFGAQDKQPDGPLDKGGCCGQRLQKKAPAVPVGLTPLGWRRSARTRPWPFAHSPPTPPLLRPPAPRTPRKPAMARGRTNGQPGSAGAPAGVVGKLGEVDHVRAAPGRLSRSPSWL